MQVEVPQILWHYDSRQIMSIDIYPNSNYLVTSSVLSDEDTGIRVSSLPIYTFLSLIYLCVNSLICSFGS